MSLDQQLQPPEDRTDAPQKAPALQGIRRRLKTERTSRTLFAYAFLAPLVAVYVLLMVYPLIRGLVWSTQELSLADLAGGGGGDPVGLGNYVDLFGDQTFIRKVLPNTALFVFGSVFLQVVFGMGLAILLDQSFIIGRRLLRTMVLIPWVTANVVVAFSWVFIYDSRIGLANRFLTNVGADPIAWLSSATLVMPAIIVANVWRGTAFAMLVHTSGLQGIPEDVYEASTIDGASRWQSIRHITIPLLRKFTLLSLLYGTMATLNVFDLIFVMTGGGPRNNSSVASLYMYDQAFVQGNFGYGAAISTVLLVLNIVITFVYLRGFGDEGDS